jgi:two-component system nitrate/nitrite response regulator NarP
MSERRKDTISIVIADKSPLVQSGLAGIFAEDGRFTLLASAADSERFMEAVRRLSFDIGVIGWDMPYMSGGQVIEALARTPEPPRIVVYTGNEAPGIPRRVMELGGAAFCHKSEPPGQLVETVAAGRMVFPFMDLSRRGADPLDILTKRERELLGALAKGATNPEIVRRLGISTNTVKFHLKNLYGKLHVTNRSQAVAR